MVPPAVALAGLFIVKLICFIGFFVPEPAAETVISTSQEATVSYILRA
jgi:hypothetical protein